MGRGFPHETLLPARKSPTKPESHVCSQPCSAPPAVTGHSSRVQPLRTPRVMHSTGYKLCCWISTRGDAPQRVSWNISFLDRRCPEPTSHPHFRKAEIRIKIAHCFSRGGGRAPAENLSRERYRRVKSPSHHQRAVWLCVSASRRASLRFLLIARPVVHQAL